MKQKSVRATFAKAYVVIITAALFVMIFLYSVIEFTKLEAQTEAVLSQNISSVVLSIERELQEMHTTALNIAYSMHTQDHFFDSDSTSYAQRYALSRDSQTLLAVLTALIFPNRPVDQIKLYSTEGTVVASGLQNSIYPGFANMEPWYLDMQQAENNQLFFFTGYDDEISKFSTDIYGKYFVSLILQYFNNFNLPSGYVEIKQRLSRIVSPAMEYQSVYGENIYIFTKDGEMIFPLNQENETELFAFAKSKNFPQTDAYQDKEGNHLRMVCQISSDGNLHTIMSINESLLLSPIYRLIYNFICIALVALFCALFVGFFVAKRITSPIAELCRQCSDFDISATEPTQSEIIHTKIRELNELQDAFSKMQMNLTKSVQKQLLLEHQEMQSKMLALQSQMNPHFLFNSLAAIQVMADEGMSEEITTMCQSMSSILRYIASDSESEVPLIHEIYYTTDYLTCMEVRYQGDLEYTLDIPKEMEQIKVPKLCVQLLVENAIKYTTTKRPPYKVEIKGTYNKKGYQIEIKDNGAGFSEEALSLLHKKMEDIKETSLLPSLEINGMGLLNVFIRYRLLYQDRLVFNLKNNIDQGACITIGEVYDNAEI
ncbi:MAG: histidine kinase [Bacillota bacterium]